MSQNQYLEKLDKIIINHHTSIDIMMDLYKDLKYRLDEAERIVHYYSIQENYHYNAEEKINYIWNDQGKRAREYKEKWCE